MATLPEIALRLAAFIEASLLPDGQGKPSAIPGYTGSISVFENYPISAELDRLVANGGVAVAVTPMGDAVATKRFPVVDQDMTRLPTPMGAVISGNAVTLTGQPVSPLNVAVVVDRSRAYIIPVQPRTTIVSLAAAFANQIAPLYPGSVASGASFSVAGADTIEVRVGVYANTRKEIGRQMSHFRVTVWCQDDGLRNQAVMLSRTALDDLRRFTDLDGWGVNIRSGREIPVLDALRTGWARNEVLYPVEFGVTTGALIPSCVFVLTAQSQGVEAQSPATVVYTPDPDTGIEVYLDAAARTLISIHASIPSIEFGNLVGLPRQSPIAAVSPVTAAAVGSAAAAEVETEQPKESAVDDTHGFEAIEAARVLSGKAAASATALNPARTRE